MIDYTFLSLVSGVAITKAEPGCLSGVTNYKIFREMVGGGREEAGKNKSGLANEQN